MTDATHLVTATSSTALTTTSTASPNTSGDANAPRRHQASRRSSPTATKATTDVLPREGHFPATGYRESAALSWQVKAVLSFLFAFLMILLAALCYTLFNFLTAVPEPTVSATPVTNAQTTTDTEETTTDAQSNTMAPAIPRHPPVPRWPPSPISSSSTPRPAPPPRRPITPPSAVPSSAPLNPTPVPSSSTTLSSAPPNPSPVPTSSTTLSSAPPAPQRVSPPSTEPSTAPPTPKPLPRSRATPPPSPSVSRRAPSSTPTPMPTPPSVKRPMGDTPLFCTFGVHMQDYDKINVDVCDYAFIPFYVRGGDTFTDDSNKLTRKLINKAVASTKTSYVISVPHAKRRAALKDVNSQDGQGNIGYYWAYKNIYHYAVFDIGIQDHELSRSTRILKEAFDLLKAFRTQQVNLKAIDPSQKKPERGFVVASFYLWQSTKSPVIQSFTNNMA